jgi:hypothetical protein
MIDKNRVYLYPRMSLKMICEYVTASATRRSTIIKNSCIIPTFIVKRYNMASEIISTHKRLRFKNKNEKLFFSKSA